MVHAQNFDTKVLIFFHLQNIDLLKIESMNNNTINFSYNWNNKLDNKAFTTIRMHNPNKYIVGRCYKIEIKGTNKGDAILQDKRTLRIDQLNDFICYLDTGYNKQETIKMLERMYKNIDLQTIYFDFCLLVYINPKKQTTKDV